MSEEALAQEHRPERENSPLGGWSPTVGPSIHKRCRLALESVDSGIVETSDCVPESFSMCGANLFVNVSFVIAR